MDDMRADIDLLNDILDRHTRKQLCMWADISHETLSQYVNCGRNIPVGFWRSLFRATKDLRILGLITCDIACEIYVQPAELPACGRDFFAQSVTDSGKYHEMQTYIAELLRDNRIDEVDGETVQHYADSYLAHRANSALLFRAIMRTYQRSVAAKSAGKENP